MNDPSSTQRAYILEEALKLFEAWRAHPNKTRRISDELWAAAVQVCRQHSVHEVSRTLRLSCSDLRAQIEPAPCAPSNVRFVELNPQALTMAESKVLGECDVLAILD